MCGRGAESFCGAMGSQNGRGGEAETTISLVFLLKWKESNSLALVFEPGFGTKFMWDSLRMTHGNNWGEV